MTISYTNTDVVFTNEKGASIKADIFDAMNPVESVRALSKEMSAATSASKAAVSLMRVILDQPRFDLYKGATPWNERIPVELKSAMRTAEDEYIKPVFFEANGNPSPYAGTHDKDLSTEQRAERKKYSHVSGMFDTYMKNLRAGGSYAVARGVVLDWYAKAAELPEAPNGKLYSVAALKKLIELHRKENAVEEVDTGISGKLLTLAGEMAKHAGDDWSMLGDLPTGIAALSAMLEKYREVSQARAEAITEQVGNQTITGVATAAIDRAMTTTEPAPF